jgi:hypothetical protein
MGSAVGRKVSAWVGERFGSSDEAWNLFLSKARWLLAMGSVNSFIRQLLGVVSALFL